MKNLVFVLLFSPLLSFGQGLDIDLLSNMKARNIGPAGMAGRVTSIDVVTIKPDVMYVGTASGGLWKSESAGILWKPIFENQTTASIGAVAIQQSNPSVIWVGTGEGNPRNSLNAGDGLYKSLDGGVSWKKIGLSKTKHIHKIIIDPTDPDVVYVGAIGSPWGDHPERGVFKTVDGGKTWDKILFTNNRSGVADMVMDPSNPNKLIVGLWEHHRDPWFFKSGGEGSGLYVTYDGGEHWKKLTEKEGIPKGNLGRIGLAIAPSMPNRVYALIESEKNALYRSENGGMTWEKINDKSDIGNRPFYYSDIYVDPINENRVYSVFTYVNVSEDGGKNFTELMPAYNVSNGVHPDHHAWWIHPENPDFMMDGNDGGLNITRDRGKTWRFVENIPVAQFYHMAVDNEIPYNVYGGMQDNGSWVGPAYIWKVQGIRNSYWQEISFGDGFDVLPDPENSRYGISTSQQGSASIYDRVTGYNETVRPTYPDGKVDLRFNWNSAMSRDPFDSDIIYFGSQFVHKSTDRGQNWDIISPDLTTDNPEKQKQDESGGLTMDATGAENHCTLLVIEPSPVQDGLLWVGSDDGQVHISKNGGDTWQNLTENITGVPAGAWINQIKASNKTAGEAYIVINDYRRFNYIPYVYRTSDYGKSWTRIVDQSDVISYALSIVEDPIEKNLLFLGTDDGLYVSLNAGSDWSKWTHGFPTTNAMDLVIHPREHDLVIGTFGRAAYVLDDIRPLRAIATEGLSILSSRLKVYTPPTAYTVATQQPSGSRFGADAVYQGENRSMNARISYSIKLPSSDKEPANTASKMKKKSKTAELEIASASDEKELYDSLKFEVLNTQNDVVRTIKIKAPEKSGIHRFEWGLEEKGAPRISRSSENLNNSSEPGGVTVLPGTYKLRFTFGDRVDSTLLTVENDPRLEITPDELKGKYFALKSLESTAMEMSLDVEKLKKALILTEKIEAEVKKDEAYELIKEDLQTTSDTLNAMLDLFFGKKDDRQGITARQTNTVLNQYRSAYRYTNNALHLPSTTENKLIQKFNNEYEKASSAVTNYFDESWPIFRKKIEAIDLNPFRDFE
ncbi:MAG: photosystem II stability/assembly factor-like uncharacterized protein [Paraglaciecola sp.]|jgi:photosystem II stability/assembly factor-like uncharacterized protein